VVTITELTKEFGGRTLFRDVSLQLHAGHRYGVIGANGSGKSTFLRILTGEERESGGNVVIPKSTRVGVLEQDHFQYEDVPILHVVMMGHAAVWSAMTRKEALLSGPESDFDADLYSSLEETILRLDGYALEARAAEILEGMGIPTAQHDAPLSVLSGGYKLRVLLARTLAGSPDLLLLDEPTNHLDILSLRWLESFLARYNGCAVVVSHDHRFLDNMATHILDVDYETVTLYKGDYSAFVESKGEHRDRQEREIARREKEIAEHKAFIARFKAKATKARQANSRQKRMEKIVIHELPQSSRRYPKFKFPQCRPSGRTVLEAVGISKSYGDKTVLDGVDLEIQRGDRVAIIGPNGIGKSTLLKVLQGLVEADDGLVEWGYETHRGYFAQDHHDVLGEEHTVSSWLWEQVPQDPQGAIYGRLAQVLFSRDDADKRVPSLSGGEAARLVLAGVAAREPNVLILDEPTNHLDLEGIRALATALSKLESTLLLVSHDRWFVSRVATRIIEIHPDGVRDFRGTYDQYLKHCGTDHLDRAEVVARAKEAKRQRRRV
jgi:ATPase subunit of ABC transporter with duplicated ATPase domains